jgi:hypothetical protein
MTNTQDEASIWRCEWCGTANSFTGRKSDERCLACRKFCRAPVWTASNLKRELEQDELRNAYLLGHYAEIAVAASAGLVADLESRHVRDSMRLALTAELGSMESYWGYADETRTTLTTGWVWPQQSFVTGLTLHLERNGKRAKNSVDRPHGRRKMAVNLEFEKALDPSSVTLSVSLFYRGHRKIETRPVDLEFSSEVE